ERRPSQASERTAGTMTLDKWERKVLDAPGAPGRVAEIEDELRLAAGLTALREQAGLSQRDLAKRIGVTQPRVAAIERARNVAIVNLGHETNELLVVGIAQTPEQLHPRREQGSGIVGNVAAAVLVEPAEGLPARWGVQQGMDGAFVHGVRKSGSELDRHDAAF